MRTFPLRGVRWLLVVLPLGLVVGCGARPVDASAPPGPPIPIAPQSRASLPPTPTPMPKPPPTKQADTPNAKSRTGHGAKRFDADALVKAAASVEPNTTLGAFVFDRTTGTAPIAYNADRSFRSASLVKLLIAIDALESGTDIKDRERLARMLSLSDDDIASMYWVKDGGPRLVTRTAAELGLRGVRPPEVAGQWGEVVVTPRDIATIYQHVLSMPPDDRALIVDALEQAPEIADDGFDQYFGIPSGFETTWAIKQGWGNNSEAMVLHSTGLVGPDLRYIVVLLTEHPLGSGWQASARSVTAAARAINGHLPGIMGR